MEFIKFDITNAQGGSYIEVEISAAANVMLMDSSNFNSFKAGRNYRYQGGYVQRSPHRLVVPSNGSWKLVVFNPHGGAVRASMRILPGALSPAPILRPAPIGPSLTQYPSLVRQPSMPNSVFDDTSARDAEVFDVFISHASEDKADVVEPLVAALQAAGLSCWYDALKLKIGSSLRKEIDHGLARSRFGLIVLSEAYIAKGWTNYELEGIVTRSTTGEQIILPIWHNITKQRVVEWSPTLADKVARSTATYTIADIAAEIVEVINAA
jgi:hypothetical protein